MDTEERPDAEAFRLIAEWKEKIAMETKQLGLICLTILLCAAMVLCGVSMGIKSDVSHLQKENERLTKSCEALEYRVSNDYLEAKKYRQRYDDLILQLESKLGKSETVVEKLMKMSIPELKKIAEER